MNNYTANEREQAKVNRQHFMLFHFVHFPECRSWSAEGMVRRLKAEGLIAKSTNWKDCGSVIRFWNDLKLTLHEKA